MLSNLSFSYNSKRKISKYLKYSDVKLSFRDLKYISISDLMIYNLKCKRIYEN